MSKTIQTAVFGSLMLFLAASCGPLEVRIGKEDGVRPIRGSFQANLESGGEPSGRTWQCGDTITATDPDQTYTVTTTRVQGGCKFDFDQQVELFVAADYQNIRGLRQATRFLNRIELTINQFDLYEADGTRIDVESRIRNAELWVNGQQVLDIETLRGLPRTVVIEGEPINLVKRAVRNREPVSATIKASITIYDSFQPRQIRCDYDSQPTYVLSSSEL